ASSAAAVTSAGSAGSAVSAAAAVSGAAASSAAGAASAAGSSALSAGSAAAAGASALALVDALVGLALRGGFGSAFVGTLTGAGGALAMPAWRINRPTLSDGLAPFAIQASTHSASSFTVAGSVKGS